MTTKAPSATTLGALLHELADRQPDRPAISFDGCDHSFREVDLEVDRFAKAFLAEGIGHGDAIAVWSGNRPSWLYAAMAAARIGAVTVPINTWYRQDELRYALGHADVKLLLFADRLRDTDYAPLVADAIPASTISRSGSGFGDPDLPLLRTIVELGDHRLDGAVPLPQFLAAGNQVSDDELAAAEDRVRPNDLALLIFTSGSTAKPKCVALEHHPMIINTFNIGERQALDASDRSFLATPLFYGLGVIQGLGATWTHGACVVLMEAYEPGQALQILEREQCTAYYGLGNMTRSLVGHPDHRTRRLVLRKGVLGLSAADRKLARTELGLDLGTSIYGLTESYGLCALTDAYDPIDLRDDTIGTALPDWDIRIADPDTDLAVPTGTVGQILIRGHLMRGYHKDSERTAQTLTADGFFRTGDLGWLDDRGYLHFHSRLSELMKPGGINVSPVEVEVLAGQVPGVREVHAVGIPDPARGEAIVVFVDADPETVPPEAIRHHIRDTAAKYKAPHHVLYRAGGDLPRVASGKVPKTELRAIALAELGLDAAGTPRAAEPEPGKC
ncbi:AMP-binding protein [Mycolicibacterium sp.]|uniref:AMP-binding protein n=2 Tax=Mycolicibacterium sp. TaxID=2320850 RepID=UPI003D12F1EC